MKAKLSFFFWLVPFVLLAQSKTMRELDEAYPDAFALVFYHSSLNMLNVDDDPDFDRMISNINKIKLLRIERSNEEFTDKKLSDLKVKLADRDYEELMIVKGKGYDTTVYMQEDQGEVKGFFLYVLDDDSFMAFDVDGILPVKDIGLLVEKIKDVKGLK